MGNINSVLWESRNIATQPGEIYYRKSEVIAFVVNDCVNITTNSFDVQIQERCFFVRSICLIEVLWDIYQEYAQQIEGYQW